MMDALNAQKKKMADKRASMATPPAIRNTPPPKGGGGFNTNMLQRAQMTKQFEPDSESDDWSDSGDEKEAVVAKKVQEALKPAPRLSNSNLKATTVAPPSVVKAPPSRPKDVAAEKKISTPEKKEEAPPPPPAGGDVSSSSSKLEKDDDDDDPPPPPPVDSPVKSVSPSKSPVRPPKKSGGDEDDQAIEIAELKRKLENAEAKLAEGGNTSNGLLREAVLEEQLERAHATIVTLKHDKNALKLSIKELQIRLTNAQVSKKNGGEEVKSQTAAAVQEAMKRGEREKDLEKQLIKAKKDKDKSLKLLIQLIGKERIAEHLQKHAGEGDVLDSLVTHFSGSLGGSGGDDAPPSRNSGAPHSPKKKRILGVAKGSVGTMGRPALRSRSDQYFYENQY